VSVELTVRKRWICHSPIASAALPLYVRNGFAIQRTPLFVLCGYAAAAA